MRRPPMFVVPTVRFATHRWRGGQPGTGRVDSRVDHRGGEHPGSGRRPTLSRMRERRSMGGMGNGRITVFLADDNVIVREGVRALLGLEHDLEIVGTADDYDSL